MHSGLYAGTAARVRVRPCCVVKTSDWFCRPATTFVCLHNLCATHALARGDMATDTKCWGALSLVAFAAGKNRDYASHWLKRQLAKTPGNKPFARLLTDDRLRAVRGGHSVYVLDRHTAHRFVMLFPREWPVPQRLLDGFFFSSESQRADMLLDEFALASAASGTRKSVAEHVFAAHSEGNGTKIDATRSSDVRKALGAISSAVRQPYSLLHSVRCKHAAPVLAVVASLLKARQAPVAHTRLFDVPHEQLARVFRALRVLKRRAEKRPQSRTCGRQRDATVAEHADDNTLPIGLEREAAARPPAKRARHASAGRTAPPAAAGALAPAEAACARQLGRDARLGVGDHLMDPCVLDGSCRL